MTTDMFDDALFYDTDDSAESLTHESVAAAIEYHFDAMHSKDRTLEQDIAEYSPVTVYAWQRVGVSLEDYAETLVDHLEEAISEDDEYGVCENANYDMFKYDRAKLIEAVASAIAPFSSQVMPWSCEQVAKREYSAQEVEAILRKECSEWFIDGKGGAA